MDTPIAAGPGRFGFTGGTLSTQFPVINNVQLGNTGDYIVDGSFNSLPPVPAITLPSNGRINPAPNEAFFVIHPITHYPTSNSNLTYQRQFNAGLAMDIGYVGNLGKQLPYNQELNAAYPGTGPGRACAKPSLPAGQQAPASAPME